jgi:hypothetical protein
MKNKPLRLRISDKDYEELQKWYRLSGMESLSSFLRHIIFNIGIPKFKEYMEEKNQFEKIKKFIFEDKKK